MVHLLLYAQSYIKWKRHSHKIFKKRPDFDRSLLPTSGSVQGIPQRSALPSYCNVSGQFTGTISIENEFCLVLPPRRSSLGVIKVAT